MVFLFYTPQQLFWRATHKQRGFSAHNVVFLTSVPLFVYTAQKCLVCSLRGTVWPADTFLFSASSQKAPQRLFPISQHFFRLPSELNLWSISCISSFTSPCSSLGCRSQSKFGAVISGWPEPLFLRIILRPGLKLEPALDIDPRSVLALT